MLAKLEDAVHEILKYGGCPTEIACGLDAMVEIAKAMLLPVPSDPTRTPWLWPTRIIVAGLELEITFDPRMEPGRAIITSKPLKTPEELMQEFSEYIWDG